MSSLIKKARRFLLSWLDSNEFPWMWPRPFLLSPSEKQIQILRISSRRALRHERIAAQGWARTFTQAAAWPIISMIKAWISTCHQYPQGASLSQYLTTWINKWWMQVWHQFRISDQGDIQLLHPDNRRRIRSHMPCRELQVINNTSNRQVQGWLGIEEKLSFARFCQKHSLPHPLILAASDTSLISTSEWPASDLFLKPANMGKGMGMEVIQHVPETGSWLSTAGDSITSESIGAYAKKRYQGGPWLLQPRLMNASEWRGLAPRALSTIRIITGRIPNGEPTMIGSFVRFPMEDAIIDNLSAGGVGAGVLGENGIMTSGWVWHGPHIVYKTHPDTGARIEGAQLHRWPELKELALQAHRDVGNWSTVGWDVALSTEGPLLIEANLNWSIMPHQPLDTTPFIPILQSLFGAQFELFTKKTQDPLSYQ